MHMNATATTAPAGRASGPQYMRALERANKVRLARAELKRRVATGELTVAEVVVECPWEAHSMTVADLLMSQRRWGQSRCRKFLAQVPMSETKTVGSMTDRQRHTLAEMLQDPARPRPSGPAEGLLTVRAEPPPASASRSAVRRKSFDMGSSSARGHAYA
jgi:hypothetical protein